MCECEKLGEYHWYERLQILSVGLNFLLPPVGGSQIKGYHQCEH